MPATPKITILNVDDNEVGRYATSRVLQKAGFEVKEAATGMEALRIASQQPDIIVLDVNLPDISGFEVCRTLKENIETTLIPVLHLSATCLDSQSVVEGLEGGADAYLTQPVEPQVLVSTIKALLRIHDIEKSLRESDAHFRATFEQAAVGVAHVDLDGQFLWVNQKLCDITGYSRDELLETTFQKITYPEDLDVDLNYVQKLLAGDIQTYSMDKRYIRKDGSLVWVGLTGSVERTPAGHFQNFIAVVEDITTRKKAEADLKNSLDNLRKVTGNIVHVISQTVEARDPYTAGHQKRVSDLARAIAYKMGLSNETIEIIRTTGSIHDIGKISIPAEILSKPVRLTEIEFALIKNHPQAAYEILKDIEFNFPLAEIILQHHERLDGSGYPRGLKGNETLLEARVLATADVVEAMASHRPYRPALGIDAALNEIRENRGVLYDKDAVDICLRLFKDDGFRFE